jgi:hypothetical protein
VARVGRPGVEAVHEIEVAGIGHAAQIGCGWAWITSFQPICGTLKRLPSGWLLPSRRKRTTSPPIRPSPAFPPPAPSSLRSSSICMPMQRPSAACSRRPRAPPPRGPIAELAHAVGHGALAGQDHRSAARHLLGIAGDDDAEVAARSRATCATACETERRLPIP